MRIVFAGSPAIAVPSLKKISSLETENKGITLAGLITNPDSPRGRRGELVPTDVSAAAAELGVPQLKPDKLNREAREAVSLLKPDLLVSFAYGKIFGPRFLSLFPLGGINIHPSLLPKYRGASPIQAAILAGDSESGICIQKLFKEMDTGDILLRESFALSGNETSLSLSEAVSHRAAEMLGELLLNYKTLAEEAKPQEGSASYCYQIKKEDGLINWNDSAVHIYAQLRAFTPWPLCFTRNGNDLLFILEAEKLKADHPSAAAPQAPCGTVLAADKEHGILVQTGQGILAIKSLQFSGKKALDWRSFLNGARNFMGSHLG